MKPMVCDPKNKLSFMRDVCRGMTADVDANVEINQTQTNFLIYNGLMFLTNGKVVYKLIWFP